ncbi:Isoleucyl-tRNA synthetase [Alkalibacterium putridalgicola]|uniref:Isoleucine--tRNA ligase n=1 Tax=Alkalibacterium putridalgicola TaxID=426703 RepID=A0A1H7VV45_9LACT|nr:isoleucine--tRNA ligase [Alkalibacterium putridalgicola]GEK89878.1 isoleucine--tRNA ligase [Alkalibacterium putridalgicola]SEM12695.1 Isoleucyl-tRNA synthetase [Alkalibacterium putridalgicola]
MEMKETLNLLKTKFPMRANLPNKEPERQQEWKEQDIYGQRQELNKDKPSFILHDGPPYANGNIHIGHALNKISKDIIVRYKSMSGFRSPYVPGWDTHGLPIEQALTNTGVDRKSMSVAEFRKLCEDYAWKQINKQRDDFKRLGVAGEWDNPYVTLTKDYEAEQIRVFGKMAEKGYIYRGLKPIYWSPSSESALAEAEIEYHDVRSPNIYVAFNVNDGKSVLDNDTSFVIWTTTPWTLPANLAIAVKPDATYGVYEADGRKFVVAAELADKVAETLEWNEVKLVKEIPGKDLEGITASHPFYDRDSLLILGDHVTLEDGTGLVHTAPGHGEDDYIVCQNYDLPVLSPVDGKGLFTDEAPGLEGIFYDKANKTITEWLDENNALLKLDFFTHSYPHDWRTKKPVIFRATPQWFASIKDFRQDILEAVEEVDWLQPWGMQRIYNMVRDRGDWVISRQRAWGVPLPIFYGENGEPIITPELTEHVAELFAEHGSNVWFEREAKDLLPDGFEHPSSPNGQFEKETDIMDVWFDSGSSHHAVLRQRDNLEFPADMYLEGSDQYRGWFNSSLTTSVAINGVPPYKSVLSQGMVLDGAGKKMSKSIGNVIDPNKVIKQMGADLIRLWVSSVDTQADVRVSMDILKQVSEVYRKIRNTIRFLIQNTEDFDFNKDGIAYEDLRPVDQYLMNKLNLTVEHVIDGYERYNFSDIFKEINHFLTLDVSNFYANFAKDILYIDAPEAYDRRAMQTVFYHIVRDLTKLLTPILPHTAEEIWSYLEEEESYVQLAEFPEVKEYDNSKELLDQWSRFMSLRDNVLKANEVARENKIIGKDFEAKTTIYASQSVKNLLDSLNSDIRQILIASEINIKDLEEKPEDERILDFENVSILVERMQGDVCTRCRITTEYSIKLSEDEYLCQRCHDICEEHYPEVLNNN